MATDQQILLWNPWWQDPTAIEQDAKITALARRRLRWDPPVLDAIEIGPGRVHTLRGPRQAGKSTTAKLLIQRLLRRGERRVLYYSFDLSTSNADIAEVAFRARQLHPDPDGPWYLFFDEVTAMPDWQRGMKYIIDSGLGGDDFILCTGSSARKVGTEQLPGRRGAGRHYLQLPVSFRDFCQAVMGIALPAETLTPAGILAPENLRLLRQANLARADLERAWLAYQQVGGFPAAIEDYLGGRNVSDRTVEMVWDIIASDVQELGRSAAATLKLLERVGRSLGAPLAWNSLAEDMDVTQQTARDYVELLARSFILLTVFAWDTSGRGLSVRKQRKVYFADPLIGQVATRLMPGSRPPRPEAVRENLVAIGLYRSATDRLVQADALPGSLCFWKSGRGTEIDFLVAEETAQVQGERVPVEVKGDARAALGNARKSIGRAFGRGVVVTERHLDLDNNIPAVPAPVFLAVLRERPERKSASL
ncbi:MAG: ATP-binding protein [Gemmatimonadota bacterium]